MFRGFHFGQEAGYWPWAIIVAIVTAALVYGLRVYYKVGQSDKS